MIPAVHIQGDEAKFTIIYSHGNAEDVGLSLPYLDHLSRCCNCDVLAYEYCGYSIAEGESSEKNCYECIDAAYLYLVNGHGSLEGDFENASREKRSRPWGRKLTIVDPSRIVLFGRSLGTGPTIDLAARLLSENDGMKPSIAGVILQSPLESAGRCVLSELASNVLYHFDLFRSYEKIEKLAPVPVFLIHGIDDKIVPYSSGRALYVSLTKERTRRRLLQIDSTTRSNNDAVSSVVYPPRWIPGVGHNDMPEFECMSDVTKFLIFLEGR